MNVNLQGTLLLQSPKTEVERGGAAGTRRKGMQGKEGGVRHARSLLYNKIFQEPPVDLPDDVDAIDF